MSKKSKRKSGKGKDKVTIDYDLFKELALKDSNFYMGTSQFVFPNEDTYEGEFCAHTKGLIWRQGYGTYTTKDGQIYIGEWDGDRLISGKEVEIRYPDGTKYLGGMTNDQYSGCGLYQLDDNVTMVCNFTDNKPEGDVSITDPNGRVWHGYAEDGDSLLVAEHPFYRAIGKDLGKGRSKNQPPNNPNDTFVVSDRSTPVSEEGPRFSEIRDIERNIFGKSKKTSSDLQLDRSEWFQNYKKYCNDYGKIIAKVKKTGEDSLKSFELDWYTKYKEFEKKYTDILTNRKQKLPRETSTERITMFIGSEEYKKMIRSVSVIYPTSLGGEDCDSFCECPNH